MKSLPNLLTASRILLGALIFFLLAGAGGDLPGQGGTPPANGEALIWTSFVVFAFAAITDYFDGWLARKLQATSPWGAVLDPIADKIAVAAAILGLSILEPKGMVPIPGFIILFREVFVSGLREGIAPLGVRLPVTRLAKWKTTVQLFALALSMPAVLQPEGGWLRVVAGVLLWVAALITLITGAQYAQGAAKALGVRKPPVLH